MNILDHQWHQKKSAELEFADFKPFQLGKGIKKVLKYNTYIADFKPFQLGNGIKKVLKYNTYITDLGRKFQNFLVNEVIDRIEKESFTLKCSVRAMAFLETLYCYSRIKTGVGMLTLASCDIILEVDFKLAEYTIIYDLHHWRTEEPLLRFIIAE